MHYHRKLLVNTVLRYRSELPADSEYHCITFISWTLLTFMSVGQFHVFAGDESPYFIILMLKDPSSFLLDRAMILALYIDYGRFLHIHLSRDLVKDAVYVFHTFPSI